MKCPSCQTENPDDNLFCRKCGEKFSAPCPQCGAEVLEEDTFCGKCGHKFEEKEAALPIDFSEPQSYTPKHLRYRPNLKKILPGFTYFFHGFPCYC